MATSLQIVQKFHPDVTKVADAKRPLTINLRPSDSKSARAKKHDACAMAVACVRQCKVDGAIVSTNAAYLIEGKKATRYTVPPAVGREIVAFDRGAGFAPGTYTLNVPSPSAKLGQTRGGARSTRTGRQVKARKYLRSAGLRTALSAI
jgi:hypothetical protein